MKTQHTPGPWTIEPDCMFGERVVGPEINGARNILHQGDGPDARLIASAPDLLGWLERVEHWYTVDGTSQAQPFPSIECIRLAIAKAKGETL